jgi:hypothetical protein
MNKIGIGMIIFSLALFLIEKTIFSISAMTAKLYCGQSYLSEINGVLSEQSCGFDADMNIVVALFVLLLTGGVILYRAK